MTNTPKVSIVTIAYNQEKYIRAALDSFVAQKTDFVYEVIVADDCSSDSTPEIISEYARAYPDIFKPILRKKNVGAIANCINALQMATGEYVAMCEGDDYWTDPKKLQIQVDFLDSHQKYALCFHLVRVFFENGEEKAFNFPDVNLISKFTVKELLKGNFIQTNSVMYRRQKYDNLPVGVMPLDWYLHLYHAQFGNIGFIDKVMADYRRHPGGIWWSGGDPDQICIKYGLPHLALHNEVLKMYGANNSYRKIINTAIINLLSAFIRIDQKFDKKLFQQAIEMFPGSIETYAINRYHELKKEELIVRAKQGEIQKLQQELQSRDIRIRQLAEENRMMKASRIWKMRNKAAKLLGRNEV